MFITPKVIIIRVAMYAYDDMGRGYPRITTARISRVSTKLTPMMLAPVRAIKGNACNDAGSEAGANPHALNRAPLVSIPMICIKNDPIQGQCGQRHYTLFCSDINILRDRNIR